MKTLNKIGLISIPLTFMLAGIGMIWLYKFDSIPSRFFEKLISNRYDWLGAHIILLASTIFLLPAAINIRLFVTHKIVGIIATTLTITIAVTNILLAGQYAIDFIMPILADIGGSALKVHSKMFENALIDSLFYKLPNLVFLALFLLTCTLFWSKKVPSKIMIILVIHWLFVLTGNLIHPLFQRIAILLLAFSFIPVVYQFWKKDSPSIE